MTRLVILPYKLASTSAKRLAVSLRERLNYKVKRIRVDGTFRPRRGTRVFGYGSSVAPSWLPTVERQRVINLPESVAQSSDKRRALRIFGERSISSPKSTMDMEQARDWLANGKRVVARTLVNSHSGRGIIIVEPGQELPVAPLYTLYKKKSREFRIHIFNGKVIDFAEKKRSRAVDDVNYSVRNHANGWIFARENVIIPESAFELAIAGTAALGLDFGAADIIWNEHEQKPYILEVNTAPGLEGQTIINYTNATIGWLRSTE